MSAERSVNEDLRKRFDLSLSLARQSLGTDPVKAKKYAKEALLYAKSLNTLQELGQAHFILGTTFVVLGSGREAIPHLRKAIKSFEELNDKASLVRARGNLAGAYSLQNQGSSAMKQYLKLLQDFKELKDWRAVAKTHYNISIMLQKNYKLGEAMQHIDQALNIYKRYPEPEMEVEALTQKAYFHTRLMEQEKGFKCYTKAMAIAETLDNPVILANVYSHAATAYMASNKSDQAMELWKRSLTIARKLKILHMIALPLSNMAEILSSMGKHAKAEKYALEALKLDLQTDIGNYIAQDHFILGNIYLRTDRIAEAEHHLKTCLNIAAKQSLEEVHLSASLVLVSLYTTTKEYPKADSLIKPLLEKLETEPVTKIHFNILETASELNTARGNFKESNRLLTRYSELVKEYILTESTERAYNLMVVYETKRREREKRWLKKQNRELEKRVQQEVAKHLEKDKLIAEQENLALLGRITAGIAHELNNPLAAIKQIVEITLLSMEQAQTDNLYLAEKQADIYRMLHRINRLVEVIKVIAHSPDRFTSHPFNLNEVVTEFVELFADRILRNEVTLVTDLTEEQLMANGDAIRYLQVVSILVKNAHDALSQPTQTKHRKIRLRTYLDGNLACLEATDNGPGMEEDILKSAKLPFYSTKGADKGLGMGLSIATTIVSNMGGELALQSTPQKGTVAIVRVPLLPLSERRAQ